MISASTVMVYGFVRDEDNAWDEKLQMPPATHIEYVEDESLLKQRHLLAIRSAFRQNMLF